LLFAGPAQSGFVSPLVAALVVAAYFLVCAETCPATHACDGVSRPGSDRTADGSGRRRAAALDEPFVTPFGLGEVRLFDRGGAMAAAGMMLAVLVTASRNARVECRGRSDLGLSGLS
jgi:hypothetical protein